MILVDTSVLIDFLKDNVNDKTNKFEYILSMNIPFGINFYIYQEILQGAKTDNNYLELKRYLDTQTFYTLKNGKDSYSSASIIFRKCRKMGFTISSSIDCLIAQTAIENDLSLLHNDSDFEHIQKATKVLRIY